MKGEIMPLKTLLKSKFTLIVSALTAIAVILVFTGYFDFRNESNIQQIVEHVETKFAKSNRREAIRTIPSANDHKVESSAEVLKGLPKLEELVVELKKLGVKEVDERLAAVRAELEKKNLIKKANRKELNQEGYQDLARLMQLIDAYYQVKIDRELDGLEEMVAKTNE